MKTSLVIILVFLLIACDESEDLTNKKECDIALTVMNRAADKFAALSDNGTETKIECVDLVEKMNEYLSCMEEGEDKEDFISTIYEFSELCSKLPS
mgnify:FL=1|tara:strand:+ start:58 stop:345 length:288 start_codon:yes stop_codon:yes gene_type:complete